MVTTIVDIAVWQDRICRRITAS